MSDYLILSRLTKIYPSPDGPDIIVKEFDLSIRKGEFVCLIGHSGCGKSTVLSMIAGLNEITGGGIILAGKELNPQSAIRNPQFFLSARFHPGPTQRPAPVSHHFHYGRHCRDHSAESFPGAQRSTARRP